mmetsp:Transcript_53001/g.105352  ORF Transcript_53001/g.105352 Transcript_53001/m.105352 type:complete len:114 (-) Transcript_53001:211-552(-)|eukprot:CAMPEP_0174722944 /NCGR_PEP_ID=MMETSP1094-20130205/39672_1 /TAXON_ID=156173 /ORGANISM="Chrysochromulina brevifilum, Strain UTEX LB 985" /LENGTH=113 /DNA_ID=CAMNT_0015923899 /DNA_START=20 /DNA_END=361 /DNA_ORIENTATION=-
MQGALFCGAVAVSTYIISRSIESPRLLHAKSGEAVPTDNTANLSRSSQTSLEASKDVHKDARRTVRLQRKPSWASKFEAPEMTDSAAAQLKKLLQPPLLKPKTNEKMPWLFYH